MVIAHFVCNFNWWFLQHSRYLFWTEWGQTPCIGRAHLDGSEKVVLVSLGIAWPNGISIDYEVGSSVFQHALKCAVFVTFR